MSVLELAMTTTLSTRRGVYVGSFDPLTLGHEDLIRRGAAIFDHLVVGIGINPEKHPLFSPEERMQMIVESAAGLKNVTVECFEGLTVDFVRRCNAKVMLRGVRTLTDIDAEFTMALANRVLAPEIETMFLMASERYTHVSSSLIKQVAQLGGREAASKLEAFVPKPVIQRLIDKLPGNAAAKAAP